MLFVQLGYKDGHGVRPSASVKPRLVIPAGSQTGVFFITHYSIMDKHLKVLYIKVPSIHSPLHYEVFYNTTQITSELQLTSIPLAKKVTFSGKDVECVGGVWSSRTKSYV